MDVSGSSAEAVLAPVRVPVAAWVAAAVAVVLVYAVLQENGAVLAQQWETLHELFHDGRHLLGVPCH
jgi:hypothetical protein